MIRESLLPNSMSLQDREIAYNAFLKGNSNIKVDGVITVIPVVVHIMHIGEAEGVANNISDEQVLSAITQLNNKMNSMNFGDNKINGIIDIHNNIVSNITQEDVFRNKEITIEYFDENFKKQTLKLDGLAARVVQHEYDHIQGVLFTDKLSSLKKRLIKKKLDNISKGKINPDYRMRFYNPKKKTS